MSEFALVLPILVMLMMGMVLAGMYAFRAAAVDWGLFVTGVGTGSYNVPADGVARQDILWADIRARLKSGLGEPRRVESEITIDDGRQWIFGVNLVEAQRGKTKFRLWRFYPGPPPAGVNE